MPAAWKASGVWQDPKEGKRSGELAKYQKHNPDEAAKLMKAAGKYPDRDGVHLLRHAALRHRHLQAGQQQVIVQMLQEGGHFKFSKINTPDHVAGFDPQYLFGHGQYEGMSPQPFGTWPEFSQGIFAIYMPGGRNDYVYKKVPKAHEPGDRSTAASSTARRSSTSRTSGTRR